MHWLANRNGSRTRSRRRRPYKPEEREGMSERQSTQSLTTFCSLEQPPVCPMVLAKLRIRQ
jgi:hypothetical protein